MPDRPRFSIVPIGSSAAGFALKVDGVVVASDPNMIRLAEVDAMAAGATDYDAGFIAEAMKPAMAGARGGDVRLRS